MTSIMLLAISAVAVAQFALYYWRAVVAGVAAQPVSERVLAAAGLEGGVVTGSDFEKLAGLHDLTPPLRSREHSLGFVRFYYKFAGMLEQVAGSRLPSVTAWSRSEMAICARYAAVCIDRRLQENLACVAAMRSC
jgi:hypothetical protein